MPSFLLLPFIVSVISDIDFILDICMFQCFGFILNVLHSLPAPMRCVERELEKHRERDLHAQSKNLCNLVLLKL